jgi:radical SAM-linked protein
MRTSTESSALVKELHQHCRRIAGSRAKINVSISTFVPKPHTPFQWEPQISLEESKRKLDYLRSALRRPGIQMKWQNPEVSYIEGIWSRGDRRLSGLLVTAFEEGCRFDGWSDHFDFVRWQRALEKEGFGDDVTRRRTVFETLPWDHVDNGVSREFLVEEREKALAGRLTGDCRMDACQQCGVCDFTSLAPVTFDQADFCRNAQTDREKGPSGEESHRYRIYYSKTGPARFLGHIELAKTFSRAARRATLPLSFSRGFHPMPKISFTDPLPIGMESEREETVFVLARKMDSVQLSRRLARQLPEGLTVVDCHAVTSENPPSPLTRPGGVTYEVELAEGRFRKTDLESYANARSVVVTKKGKKGKIRTIELKERVALRYLSPRRLRLTIGSSTGSQLRPRHILEAVFHLTERQVLTARTLKLAGGHQE